MVKVIGRPSSRNIEDRRDEDTTWITLDRMKRDTIRKGDSPNAWDYLMTNEKISPTSGKFEPRMKTGDRYEYSSFKKTRK